MEISFEHGSGEKPTGHALLYFVDSSDQESVWATYLIILPIEVEVSKYVPPFLMNQLGDAGPKGLSAFAFPPAPEQVSGKQELEALAGLRRDDILFGGPIDTADVSTTMYAVNDAIQKYADLYFQATKSIAPIGLEDSTGVESVNEVLYGLMSDSDKLSELTKLVGRLKFAIEGSGGLVIEETENEIAVLAKHLPDHHHISRLIKAVKGPGAKNARLAELYLQRSYYLIDQSFTKLTSLQKEIDDLESEDVTSN